MDDRNRSDRNRYRRGQRGDYRDPSRSYGSRQAEQFEDDGNYSQDFGYGGGSQMGESRWRSYDDSQSRMSDHGAWGGGGMERRGYGAQHDRFAQGAYGDSHRSSFGSSQRDRGMGWSGGGYGGAYDDRSRASSAYGLQGDSGYGATYGRADNRSVHGRSGSWDDSGHDRGFFERASDEVASWFGDEDAARRRKQDHRGNGPANYNRSDERVLEDACDRLTEDWTLDARNVQVTVHEGEVTLDGTVDSRQAKRRAEDLVEDLSGVKHVQNNLRVQTTGTSVLASNESPRMGGNAELSRTGSGTAES